MKTLNLDAIRIDGETQARVSLDSNQVSEYAEHMREGHNFPPIVVFHDGSDYWLADGFHRYHASKHVELETIEAEVKSGTVEEAQLYAFGANARRGLSTTAEDNRSIIIRMLNHPISKSWTNVAIAKHIGVSKMTVGRIKSSVEPKKPEPTPASPAKKSAAPSEPAKQSTAPSARTTEPPAPEIPQVDERELKIAELVDTINDLNAENQRLRDAIALGQWDATDIEKIDAQETIAELRERVKTLEIDNHALRDSRDMFQTRNAELMKLVKVLQAKLKKLEA